jgi:anaerobic magnesium-protoporphyrin IX monomethyl ester cyclase
MKIALIYPPTCDPTAPYLAVPMLTGFLRANGVEVLPIDANVGAYDALLRRAPMAALRDRVEDRILTLEARARLDHADQLQYHALWQARGDAHAVPGGIDEAVAILRDPRRFFDAELYARAVDTVDAAQRVISAAYAPLHLDFTSYRTPFAFTTPEEIARDADPERDPFDPYVVGELAPRLRAAAVDAVGLSLCFPGQLQPAFAFAHKLRRELPGVHLTIGGPAITQLLIRLRGADLRAALGPFDTAVVYEGEHTLLSLLRALDQRGGGGGGVGGGDIDPRALSAIPNLVHRDRLLGAKFMPGEASEDMRRLPAPDFDGLALDRYFSPHLTLPYDPTRGCYWGKCTFCHYGLAEVGTASYRERAVETVVDHLRALSIRHQTRYFYLSQDSVAPKTIVKLAAALADAGLDLRWATDLKPERYLTAERAQTLRRGGAVACALGVESANPRVLGMIDKGAPVAVVSDVIDHLAGAGISAEAMCFTGFPTESYVEALETLQFLDERRDRVAAFIVGHFDLTHGALVAQAPQRFGVREIWQVEGDTLGTGLFYDEEVPSKSGDEPERLDRALDDLSAGWLLRRYPWAGSLSTAHTVLYYDRFGRDVFRRLAATVRGGVIGARARVLAARFDLDAASRALPREADAWHQLVRVQRRVSRDAYEALVAGAPALRPRAGRYRIVAGEPPVAARRSPAKGRRPWTAPNALR